MMKDFNDTNIPQAYSTGLYGDMNYNIAKEHAWKIVDIMINGVTEVLKDVKSTNEPVAFVFRKGELFEAGAVVEYFPNNDNPDTPGNWDYTWTWNEEDIPEGARLIKPYDAQYCSYFRTYGMTKHNMGFKTSEFQGDCMGYMLHTIKKWLDENASETEEVGVKIDGVVEFKVSVENGEKVFSIEVDGEIKQLIKDDAAIEQ